jgi:hypothetical protein
MPLGAVTPGFVFIGMDNSDINQGAWLFNQTLGYSLKWSDSGAMVGGEWHGVCTGGAYPVSVVEVRYNPRQGNNIYENDGNRNKFRRFRHGSKPDSGFPAK